MNINITVVGPGHVDQYTCGCLIRELQHATEAGHQLELGFEQHDRDPVDALNRAATQFLASGSDVMVMVPHDVLWNAGDLLRLASTAAKKDTHALHAPSPEMGRGSCVGGDGCRWGVTAYSRGCMGGDYPWRDGARQVFTGSKWRGDWGLTSGLQITRRMPHEMQAAPRPALRDELRHVEFPQGDGPRVLLAVDQTDPPWAFARIAGKLQRHLGEAYRFAVVPYEQIEAAEAEIAVAFWWPSVLRLRDRVQAKRWVVCLYDHFSWQRNEVERRRFRDVAAIADHLAVANEQLLRESAGVRLLHDLPASVNEDGVDTGLFSPQPQPETFTVGWVGNSGTSRQFDIDDLKGLRLIRAACKVAGVRLEVCDAANGQRVEHEQMPEFYRRISCYVCASQSEGTPNPVLEALACGRPVISTPVGLVPRIAKEHPVAVTVTERSIKSLAAAIANRANAWAVDAEPAAQAARAAALGEDWNIKVGAWDRVLSQLS